VLVKGRNTISFIKEEGVQYGFPAEGFISSNDFLKFG